MEGGQGEGRPGEAARIAVSGGEQGDGRPGEAARIAVSWGGGKGRVDLERQLGLQRVVGGQGEGRPGEAARIAVSGGRQGEGRPGEAARIAESGGRPAKADKSWIAIPVHCQSRHRNVG